jgi:azurin/glucose/arabinose dehydrogenase
MQKYFKTAFLFISIFILNHYGFAQKSKSFSESDFYQIRTIPVPEGIELEVGGLAPMPDGRIGVSTRRGEIWIIENPYMVASSEPSYTRFASGMHEVLGLAYKDGAFYCTQRGELTKITDTDGDGEADNYKAIATWPLSGNYHEYSYGPLFDKNGDMYVSLNLAWVGYGEGKLAKWRGWILKINPKGDIEPFATGLRSPAGILLNEAGDLFYGENQGDWVGSGRITHLEKGDFAGNPGGLFWTKEPNSPLKLTKADIPDTGEPMYKAAEKVKGFKLPAMWLPHTILGISTSDIIENKTKGKFGPFENQYFVADQGHSKIMRMTLEKVNGQYQGAIFPFVEGFQSGILRLRWGIDGSIFSGMTSRGWSSTGKEKFGLQRLEWTGKIPFEMKDIKAMPDGFEIEFTKPVNKSTLEKLSNYELSSFNYKYHHTYGSPIIENAPCKLTGVIVSDDRTKVRLVMDGQRRYYIHEVKLNNILAESGESLLHNTGYYTLNNISTGDKAKLTNASMNHAGHDMSNMPAAKPIVLAPSAKRQNEMPASWSGAVDQVISIGTKPGLQFDIKSIQVKAGSKIKWIFNNNDDMTHNMAILVQNSADAVATLAMNLGLKGSGVGYIPNTPKVLYHTGLLEPDSAETLYFIAPTKPGNYPYICTYPGHGQIMRGILKVVK